VKLREYHRITAAIRGCGTGSFGAATRDSLRGREYLGNFMVILLGDHGVLLGNSDSTVKLFGYLIYVSIFPLMHENGIYNGFI
jgi:hypothetical protein